MTSTREELSHERPTRPQARPLAVALDIVGADLMLRGRFTDWESGLTTGPDLDQVGVRLAIDATSAAGHSTPALFSFHSRSVESEGGGSFRAKGTFTADGGSRPIEVLFDSPRGHTALFGLSFTAKREDFGDKWPDLIQSVTPFSGAREEGEPTRLAHAWLIPPVLAAA